jgi:hypothetical protein
VDSNLPCRAIPSRSAVFFQFGSRKASGKAPDDRNVGNRSKLERTVTLEENNTMSAESQETPKKNPHKSSSFTADWLIQREPSEASRALMVFEEPTTTGGLAAWSPICR